MEILAVLGAFFLGVFFGGVLVWSLLAAMGAKKIPIVDGSNNISFVDPRHIFRKKTKHKPKEIDEQKVWEREQKLPPEDPTGSIQWKSEPISPGEKHYHGNPNF